MWPNPLWLVESHSSVRIGSPLAVHPRLADESFPITWGMKGWLQTSASLSWKSLWCPDPPQRYQVSVLSCPVPCQLGPLSGRDLTRGGRGNVASEEGLPFGIHPEHSLWVSENRRDIILCHPFRGVPLWYTERCAAFAHHDHYELLVLLTV